MARTKKTLVQDVSITYTLCNGAILKTTANVGEGYITEQKFIRTLLNALEPYDRKLVETILVEAPENHNLNTLSWYKEKKGVFELYAGKILQSENDRPFLNYQEKVSIRTYLQKPYEDLRYYDISDIIQKICEDLEDKYEVSNFYYNAIKMTGYSFTKEFFETQYYECEDYYDSKKEFKKVFDTYKYSFKFSENNKDDNENKIILKGEVEYVNKKGKTDFFDIDGLFMLYHTEFLRALKKYFPEYLK